MCVCVSQTHTDRQNKLFICANILNCKIVCGQIVLQPASFFCPSLHLLLTHTHTHIRAQPAFLCDFIFRRNKTESFMAFMWFYLLLLPCLPPPHFPLPRCCVFNLMFINLALPLPTHTHTRTIIERAYAE